MDILNNIPLDDDQMSYISQSARSNSGAKPKGNITNILDSSNFLLNESAINESSFFAGLGQLAVGGQFSNKQSNFEQELDKYSPFNKILE